MSIVSTFFRKRRFALPLALAAALGIWSNTSTGTAEAASLSTWDKVAQCESGGNWSINTGNYYGGLQFAASTWNAYGGQRYAPYANQATKAQQIIIAQKVLAAQGQSAWPYCGPKYGLGADKADPFPMRLDTVVAGNVWDNQRNTDGTWTGASMIDGNGTVSQTATAALADGTFHVLTLAGGKVYDNQRSRDGSWSGAGLVDGSGSITALAATGMADGTMHVQTVTGGNVYENQRNPDGSWTGAALLDGNGHVTAMAAEALTDGTLHLQTLVSGNVYENQRNTNGTWTGANQLDGNG
ncbi:transglycosylase family protein, partial [Kitasatospora sp. NPDC048296]|uniref:transglycosylase family protein n=1 Tax=Kitasatospora sp. NPDC048296 TaxID=3364048 RepID=UPI003716CE6B